MKCLICVDIQRDFCPGGSLPVPEGDTIIPVVNDLLSKFELIIFTKDWHPSDHLGFASQHPGSKPFDEFEGDVLWPDHCVEETLGANFHKDVDLSKCKKDFYIFKKGINKNSQGYSAFEDTGLKEFLDERKVTDVYVCGLALDYCVKNTAIDAAMAGFRTAVIEDACKSISEDLNSLYKEFQEANVFFIESWELEMYNLTL